MPRLPRTVPVASIICEIAQQILVRRCSCGSGDLLKKHRQPWSMVWSPLELGLRLSPSLTDWARCCRSEFKRREDLPTMQLDLGLKAQVERWRRNPQGSLNFFCSKRYWQSG